MTEDIKDLRVKHEFYKSLMEIESNSASKKIWAKKVSEIFIKLKGLSKKEPNHEQQTKREDVCQVEQIKKVHDPSS